MGLFKQHKMFALIMLSIGLAAVGGIFFPAQMLEIRWIGTLFLNMLKLIALPLIFSALVSAVASMGDFRKLGTTGLYMFGYILCGVSFAVIIGLTLIHLFQPGVGVDPSLVLAGASPTINAAPLTFSTFILSMFPTNIVDAAAKFEILPIIFFSIAFAIACIATGETAKPLVSFFIGLRNVFVKMIIWLMYFTPIGLFALLGSALAEAVMQNRLKESIHGMMLFIVVFIVGLSVHLLWQLVVLKILTKRDMKQFIKDSGPALITAFGTSSSMATLPVSMVVAKKQNISDDVARLVLPFATTINLAGTAMYEAVCALFFCQILGFNLTILDQICVFLAAVVAGMGATGIPEAGLVTMVMVLRVVNVPITAISLLLPFDRILDRFRTMTNVWGDLMCAAFVDHFVAKKNAAEAALGAKNVKPELVLDVVK